VAVRLAGAVLDGLTQFGIARPLFPFMTPSSYSWRIVRGWEK
jgi:hypothetical protein